MDAGNPGQNGLAALKLGLKQALIVREPRGGAPKDKYPAKSLRP